METNDGFISVLIFEVAEGNFDKLSREIAALLTRNSLNLPGLIEGSLLSNEVRTQLWLISRWQSRHDWARSRWDQNVDQAVTDLVENAATYRAEGLIPISTVRPNG